MPHDVARRKLRIFALGRMYEQAPSHASCEICLWGDRGAVSLLDTSLVVAGVIHAYVTVGLLQVVALVMLETCR